MAPDSDGISKRFCSAPWTQGVLYMDGQLRPCCRNNSSYGEYTRIGLATAWHSESAQSFRSKMNLGIYPDEQCQACHHNGTAATLERDLSTALVTCWNAAAQFSSTQGIFKFDIETLHDLLGLCKLNEMSEEAENTLRRAAAQVAQLEQPQLTSRDDYPTIAITRLKKIFCVFEDFLLGSLRPRSVVPHRQIQLIAVCNARCIHCPGLFNQDIIRGTRVGDGFKKAMFPEEVDEALSHGEDITDFFANGSEFLVYREWRKVAEKLFLLGVKFSLSTNGILLTPSTIDFLLSHDYLSSLNISIDGGTRETIEAIRVNVSYDKLIAHLKYLFQHGSRATANFQVSISFVIMKRNYRELPLLIKLLDELRGPNKGLQLGLQIQSFDRLPYDDYHSLLRLEHISTVDHESVFNVLAESRTLAEQLNFNVRAFYAWTLADFLDNHLPLPPLPN